MIVRACGQDGSINFSNQSLWHRYLRTYYWCANPPFPL